MDEKNFCKPTYVLDASVVLKWFTYEEEGRKQTDLLKANYMNGNRSLTGPALLFWELGNYFGRVLDKKKAVESYSIVMNFAFTQSLLSVEAVFRAFTIMKTCPQTSFYDASYHALAIENNATFLTCDKKYYEKAKKLGHIKLLKDY